MAGTGNYYKIKTRKFLEDEGWKVEYLEKMMRVITKDKRILFIKKDLLESDGYAYNDKQFVLWNSTTKEHVAEHLRRYEAMGLPPFIDCWVVVWKPRSQDPPEIVEASGNRERQLSL
jgi:hypothetical protein